MVVALLVLMALIGTAYISTARYDRGSAMQNSDNVQIDLLVDAVRTLCKTAVTGDLFDGNGNYRPLPRDPYDTTNTTIPPGFVRDTYFHYDITSTLDDPNLNPRERINHWLAERAPDFGGTPSNNTNHYYWAESPAAHDRDQMVGAVPGPVRSYLKIQLMCRKMPLIR